MKYLVLKNDFQILIEDRSDINNSLIHIANNMEDAMNILNILTLQNIQTIKILNDNSQFGEEPISEMTFSTQPSLTQQMDENNEPTGRIIIDIRLRHFNETEKLQKEIEALKESQDTQDLAIDDLAAAISSIVEGE